MKVFFFIIGLLALSLPTLAQVPQGFNYQGIARDGAGAPLVSTDVSLRITIVKGLAPGVDIYIETHNVQTNKTGVFNIQVGRGNVELGVFKDINWGAGDHYVQIEMDPAGGSDYTLMGESQLLSVPYALYAGSGPDDLGFWKKNQNGIHYMDGNVGIGTLNPNAKLKIEGDDPISEGRNYISLYNRSLGSRSAVLLSLSAGDDEHKTMLSHGSETYDFDDFSQADFGLLFSTGPGVIVSAPNQNGILKFLTGHDPVTGATPERMRISSDGNIGIGTTTPNSKLTIVGDDPILAGRKYLHLNNKSTSNRSQVNLSLTAGDEENLTTLVHFSESYDLDNFGFADFGQLESRGGGLNLVAKDNAGVIRFFNGHDPVGNLPIERVRISSIGNLGLGTTSPASKVHVTGGDVYIEDIDKGVIMTSPNGSCWRMTMNDDGSVKTTSIPCPN